MFVHSYFTNYEEKIMPELNNMSDASGSMIANGPTNPNSLGGSVGQPSGNEPNYKDLYEGLERKLGSQGKELGEYRSFFENITPILTELDKSPDLVKAILDGKLDDSLAKAALEGKITVSDAQIIDKAHAEVKKEMGSKEYNAASVDDIAKLVEQRVVEATKGFDAKLREVEETRAFEASVNEFIASTPDFADYAKEINQWLDEHDITDIKVAYYAVKGQLTDREAKKAAEANAAEMAKNMALSAGAGNGRATYIPEGSDAADQLIAGRSNPNVF